MFRVRPFAALPFLVIVLLTFSKAASACAPGQKDQKGLPCWLGHPDIFYDWLRGIPRTMPDTSPDTRLTGLFQSLDPPTYRQLSSEPTVSPHAPVITLEEIDAFIEAPASKEQGTKDSWYQISTYVKNGVGAELEITHFPKGWAHPPVKSTPWGLPADNERQYWQHDFLWAPADTAYAANMSANDNAFINANLAMQIHCLCDHDSPPLALLGHGHLQFDLQSLSGSISGINLHTATGRGFSGAIDLNMQEVAPGLFQGMSLRMNFGEAGRNDQWEADVIIASGGNNLAGTPPATALHGSLSAEQEDGDVSLAGRFYSLDTMEEEISVGAAN